MATHGHIRITDAVANTVMDIEAIHDGYVDSMTEDILAGILRFYKDFIVRRSMRIRIIKDSIADGKTKLNRKSIIGTFNRMATLDPEPNIIISSLFAEAPMKYEVRSVIAAVEKLPIPKEWSNYIQITVYEDSAVLNYKNKDVRHDTIDDLVSKYPTGTVTIERHEKATNIVFSFLDMCADWVIESMTRDISKFDGDGVYPIKLVYHQNGKITMAYMSNEGEAVIGVVNEDSTIKLVSDDHDHVNVNLMGFIRFVEETIATDIP